MPVLDWLGKNAVINHHNEVPYRLVHCNGSLSSGDKDSGNLLVQGDNLVALKALLPHYAGQVKCIYIDPPYNTGNEGWVYNDNVNSDTIRKWLGKVVGKEAEDLSRHDKWLCMMYPRLKLLKEFLRDDGVIFVSIDDNEQANLKLLMDEVFGDKNFVAHIVWAAGRKNDSKLVSVSHEYILCYVLSKDFLNKSNITWRQRKKGLSDIYKQYEKIKKLHGNNYPEMIKALKLWYKELPGSNAAKAHSHYCHIDQRGVFFPDNISWPGGGGPRYDVLHPVTQKPVTVPSRGWVTPDKEKMKQWIAEDLVYFGEDETAVPCIKRYLKDREYQVPYSVFYQDFRAATKRLRSLMDENCFDFPKDETIIQELI